MIRPLLIITIFTLQLWFGLGVQAMDPTALMRPHNYDPSLSVTGWWMSEKLDGVRGYWDGKQLWSKNGHLFHPPTEFIADLPPFAVEGELWIGRNSFEETVSIVTQDTPHPGWHKVRLAIFDAPDIQGSFLERFKQLNTWFEQHPSPYAYIIDQIPIRSTTQLDAELERIVALGGEGLIVRDPQASYQTGRSHSILKVKSYQDAEAVVVAHLPGEGRNQARLGALLVERPDGVQFKIGSVITYKFYGIYQSGLPKFPVYLRPRLDAGL